MKKYFLFSLLIVLIPISYARPIINYNNLLGSWSCESIKWGNITLELHDINTLTSDPLNIYVKDGISGGSAGAIISRGYYGNYTLNVIIDTDTLSHSGLWISTDSNDAAHSAFEGLFLARETSLRELKENSLQSDIFKNFSSKNMKSVHPNKKSNRYWRIYNYLE